jgi:hypothetical protein
VVDVTSAIFEVYESLSAGAGTKFNLHRNDLAWEEDTVSIETWGQYDSRYDGDTIYDSVTTTGGIGWWSFDATELVQGWLDNDFPNYGFVIANSAGSCDYPTVLSSDTDDNNLDPKLTITYTLLSIEETTWGQLKAAQCAAPQD